ARLPVQSLGRHAVGAPEVAAVGDRDAEVAVHPAVAVDQRPGGGGQECGHHSIVRPGRRRPTGEPERAAAPTLLACRIASRTSIPWAAPGWSTSRPRSPPTGGRSPVGASTCSPRPPPWWPVAPSARATC